jgi:glucokinase
VRHQAAIGLDVGGTRINAVVVENDGTVLDQVCRTPSPAPDAPWKSAARQLVGQLTDQYGAELEVGVSAPGLPSADHRAIWNLPNKMPGIEGFDWQLWLGWPRRVPVINDGHAALLGERWLGAAVGHDHVILLTLGTGVGGAAMIDGKLLRGACGRAGHFGHMSIRESARLSIARTPGSLEDAVGNQTVAERSEGKFRDTQQLLNACQAGDPLATKLWDQMMVDLTRGVVSLINLFDPGLVLIAGGIASAGDHLMRALCSGLDRWEWRPGGRAVEVAFAELGEWAGAYGAAAAAMGISFETKGNNK